MNCQSIKEDCEVVGISFEDIDSLTVRDVISAYRKKALKVHPDKVQETDKENANEEFKILNNSYERLLKFFVEKVKKDRENEEVSEEEKFMEENFKSFNFPSENDGSFTVEIQHAQADAWQESLIKTYGEPTVHKNSKGTVGDVYWQFKFSVEEKVTNITLHIYNKPLNKKPSKLLIQSGCKSLVCIYVFSELPRIYKSVGAQIAIIEDNKTNRSLVKCDQCKFKTTLTGMKMHLKKAHSRARSKKTKENVITEKTTIEIEEQFKCGNSECDYTTNSKAVLKQHMDAIHLVPWNLRTRSVSCKKCGIKIKEGEMDNHMKSEHEENIEMAEIIDVECGGELDTSTSRVEERDCPTPIPESIYICGECNSGIGSKEDIEIHMKRHYMKETPMEERVRYLEAELRAEKEQHKHHIDTLEDTLNEIRICEQKIKDLDDMKAIQDKEIERLKIELNEKDKVITKLKNKHSEEVNELKKQQILTTENLRSTVLEKEVLRENDRVLLNTFDIMKEYIEQMKEQYSKNDSVGLSMPQKCAQCKFVAPSQSVMAEHMETKHRPKHLSCEKCGFVENNDQNLKDHINTVHVDNENKSKEKVAFCCTLCEFVTYQENSLTEHIKSTHETKCKSCDFYFENNEDMTLHIRSSHIAIKCKRCDYETISSNEMKEHESPQHMKERLYVCEICCFDSIIKENFEAHVESKHRGDSRNKSNPCINWNQGYCPFGMECNFRHEEIPACKYQERCKNSRCSYYHFNTSWNTFLGRVQTKGRHQKL